VKFVVMQELKGGIGPLKTEQCLSDTKHLGAEDIAATEGGNDAIDTWKLESERKRGDITKGKGSSKSIRNVSFEVSNRVLRAGRWKRCGGDGSSRTLSPLARHAEWPLRHYHDFLQLIVANYSDVNSISSLAL